MAHFAIPSHILTGKDALSSAIPYLKEYGSRAFIVTGKHVGKSPMLDQLKKTLEKAQIAYYVFDGITGEPTDQMIEEGLAQYRKAGCQFVIGIGGGSPLRIFAQSAQGDFSWRSSKTIFAISVFTT